MKVVQINAIYGEKSTGSIVRELDLLMQREKIESYAVYRDSTISIQNGIQVGSKFDWTLHALRTRLDGKQGYGSFCSTKMLLRKLDQIHPDVLHLHNVHSNFLNLPALMRYAKNKSIPVVLTLHDCWYFTGKCYHFADIGCEKWKTGCGNCPKRKLDIPSLLRDSSASVFSDRLQMFDYEKLYVVGCSKWVTSMAEKSPIFARAKCLTIYNGVDTTVFCPSDETISRPQGSLAIVTMANKWFEPANETVRKRVLLELQASDRLMIVGCTSTQQQEYAGDDRVNTIGYVRDRAELAALYAQGDVFLNLTHIDTLPTVNMEALSCGTPVITYRAGGSGELVVPGATGYVVEPDDIEGVICALKCIRKREVSRQVCRDYAEDHFDKQKNYEQYLQLYRTIVNAYGGNRDGTII